MDTAFIDRVRNAAWAHMPDEAVVFAYLVGSRATDGARANSDADIAVLPSGGLSAEQRATLRNRIAEIIEPAARTEVDVILLDDVPLPLRGRLLSQRQILYSADEPRRVRWESLTGRMYADSRIKLDLLDRDLLIETVRPPRSLVAHSKRWDVSAGVGFGWWIWFGVGWGLLPDVGVCPAVVDGDRERVWGPVTGDGVGQGFEDRGWSPVVAVAQATGPVKVTGLGLV